MATINKSEQSDIKHRPARSWYKISLDVTSSQVENLCAFLTTFYHGGIEQITLNDNSNHTIERIIIYLDDDAKYSHNKKQLLHHVNQLNANLNSTDQITFDEECVQEEDWNKNWKKHFKPFNLTNRLVIKPTWEEYSPSNNEIVIEMDPGLAFGTGKHASTKLALQLIEQLFAKKNFPHSILDVGTGTGILGMSCALYGASRVVGIDNDFDARVAAADNIKKNKLENTMLIDDRNLDQIPGSFDLIIANITADVLTELAVEIKERLTANGNLALSGILTGTQADDIKKTYLNMGLSIADSASQGEWTAFLFTNSEQQ